MSRFFKAGIKRLSHLDRRVDRGNSCGFRNHTRRGHLIRQDHSMSRLSASFPVWGDRHYGDSCTGADSGTCLASH